MARSEEELQALAERLVEMRAEKRYLEAEIERVGAELAAAIGEGAKRTLGSIEVRISKSRPGLRVVSAADVPVEFLRPQPDRKLLLQHIQTTGEIPPGVEASVGRPIVYAKAPGAKDSDDEKG